MAQQKFKRGDRVQLISGSPYMTVSDYDTKHHTEEELMVDVDWFDNDNNPQSGTYHQDQLKSI